MENNRVFKIGASVRGMIISSFVFEKESGLTKWLEKEFKEMEAVYGRLDLETFTLPGLKIGDTCKVYGEGDEEFKIIGLKKYSQNRYGFVLDNGISEEVAKCY